MGKFRIKIAASWFSTDYVVLKYSTNGIFWKTIWEYEYDCLNEWCYMVVAYVHYRNVESFISKFKSLDDVIKYENYQIQRVIQHNTEISESNKKKAKEKNDIYKRLNIKK